MSFDISNEYISISWILVDFVLILYSLRKWNKILISYLELGKWKFVLEKQKAIKKRRTSVEMRRVLFIKCMNLHILIVDFVKLCQKSFGIIWTCFFSIESGGNNYTIIYSMRLGIAVLIFQCKAIKIKLCKNSMVCLISF